MKAKINLIGGGFQHCGGTSAFILPKKVQWNIKDDSAPISVHVDHGIFYPTNPSKKNYAMICEGTKIIPHIVNKVKQNIKVLEQHYELIFTHDVSLLNISNKMALIPPASVPWILEKDRKIYKKTKLISMIASTKKMCDEHAYRDYVANIHANKLDLFGRGRPRELQNKIDGIKDYYFSIAMENNVYNNGYSEKISDCFVVGTIPIYYGPPVVYEMFNPEGVIDLKDFDISEISPKLYHSKFDAVKENFKIACNMPHPEDYMYEKYIK